MALDPAEPSARVSLAILKRGLDEWGAFERELDDVLKVEPNHFQALLYLLTFLQGIGRCQESLNLNERARKLEPFAPICHHRHAMKSWIFGRSRTADQVSNSALELWPDNQNLWNARVTILAFTGRPQAALRLVEDKAKRPDIEEEGLEIWRIGLRALASRSKADIARLREVSFRIAVAAPGIGANAVMLLSHLGQVDDAYQVAEGVLMRRGRLFEGPPSNFSSSGFYSNAGWRQTQWLFTPATAALRNDPRFTAFCENLGYVDYWRQRGIWPDEFVRGSLRII